MRRAQALTYLGKLMPFELEVSCVEICAQLDDEKPNCVPLSQHHVMHVYANLRAGEHAFRAWYPRPRRNLPSRGRNSYFVRRRLHGISTSRPRRRRDPPPRKTSTEYPRHGRGVAASPATRLRKTSTEEHENLAGTGSEYAQMALQGRPAKHWSPVWDREVAGDFFGKYQLVTDIFDTRGTEGGGDGPRDPPST